MKKSVGYILSGAGLLLLVFGATNLGLEAIGISSILVNIVAMILVGMGVIILMLNNQGGSKNYEGRRHAKSGGKIKDLPVYEGDDIIAYRRD